MIVYKEKKTVPYSSVGPDEGQPYFKHSAYTIPQNSIKINTTYEIHKEQLQTVSLTELYDTVYHPKTQIITNLLYSGVYLFAGAPKVGKSFFMAQLGYHVSNHKCTVLYLALEDDYARLQKRLAKMFGTDSTDNFHFATQAKSLNQGLEQQLLNFLAEHPDTRLIIIDTLQKIRESGGDRFSYASDYEIIAKLKAFADKYHVCLLVVHHTRKQLADDSFDTISGTNGLLGAADGAFILRKPKRTDNVAILDVVGRDQQDLRLHLEFDRERCIWQLTKAETALWQEPPDPLIQRIPGLVSQNSPVWIGSATELVKQLGLDMQPNVLTRRLNVSADRLWNDYGIRYECSRHHTGRQIKFTLTTG